jgi:hypothetical protein
MKQTKPTQLDIQSVIKKQEIAEKSYLNDVGEPLPWEQASWEQEEECHCGWNHVLKGKFHKEKIT